MDFDNFKQEYDQGFRWRSAWLALANKSEPNRLQSKQERIERPAVLANGRVGRAMRATDTLSAKANVDQNAMSPQLAAAIKAILGTLPLGAELRFYWKDGAQHLCMSLQGQPDQLARLNRAADGNGVIVPASLH